MQHDGFLEPIEDVYIQWGTGCYPNILHDLYSALLLCGFDSCNANLLCR